MEQNFDTDHFIKSVTGYSTSNNQLSGGGRDRRNYSVIDQIISVTTRTAAAVTVPTTRGTLHSLSF